MKNRFVICYGFTLIELLLTLSITTLLISLSVPAFSQLRMHSQKATAIEQIVSLVALARSTAVNSAQLTWFCGSPDGLSCTKTSPRFLLVFIDRNGNHSADTDEILRKEAVDAAHLRYQFTSSNLNSFRFRSDGLALSYGNIIICPAEQDNRYAAKLLVSNMGRLRHARDHNGDGIVEDRSGKPLACP